MSLAEKEKHMSQAHAMVCENDLLRLYPILHHTVHYVDAKVFPYVINQKKKTDNMRMRP